MTTNTASPPATDDESQTSPRARALALGMVWVLGLVGGIGLVVRLRPAEVNLSTEATTFRIKVHNRDTVTARRTGTIKLTRNSSGGEAQAYASIHYYLPNRQYSLYGRFMLNRRAWFHECLPNVQFMGTPEVLVPGTRIEQRYQNRCGNRHHGLLRFTVLEDGDAIMLDVYADGSSTDGSDVGARAWEPILQYAEDLQASIHPPVL
jgi:hypothetical protein